MTLFNHFAALLLCGAFVLASSPAPTATPFSSKDLRPRFLREAASLPRAGIFQDSVYTFPLVKKRASNSPAKAKRDGMVQIPTSDLMDEAYVSAFDTRLLEELKIITGDSYFNRRPRSTFDDRHRYKFFPASPCSYVDSQIVEGASDLWVVTSNCKTPNGHNCTLNPEIPRYTPSKSFQSQNESFSIAYGGGLASTFVSG